jgi:hypothetical protein
MVTFETRLHRIFHIMNMTRDRIAAFLVRCALRIYIRLHLPDILQELLPQDLDLMKHDYLVEP